MYKEVLISFSLVSIYSLCHDGTSIEDLLNIRDASVIHEIAKVHDIDSRKHTFS